MSIAIAIIITAIVGYVVWRFTNVWLSYYIHLFVLKAKRQIVQKIKPKGVVIIQQEQEQELITDISQLEETGIIYIFQKDKVMDDIAYEIEAIAFDKPRTSYVLKGGTILWNWRLYY